MQYEIVDIEQQQKKAATTNSATARAAMITIINKNLCVIDQAFHITFPQEH